SELTIDQPLFPGFDLHHQIRAARYRADAADLEAKQREADLAFEVRRAYWSLFEARAAVDAASQAVRQAEEHLENVLNFRDAGAALESDVLAARTRALDVRLQLAEAEDAASLAQFELNRLLDRSLDTHIELAPNLDELSGVAPELGPSLDEALEANAGLAALNAEVQALESMLRSSEGSWFPDIALNGRLVYARPNQYFFMDQDEFKPTWEAGAVFRWSIWSGGERSARVQEARARRRTGRSTRSGVRGTCRSGDRGCTGHEAAIRPGRGAQFRCAGCRTGTPNGARPARAGHRRSGHGTRSTPEIDGPHLVRSPTMQHERETVFEIRGVTKVYDMGEVHVHALRGIDLDLYAGELVVLLGASGSGKSTLLNILGGLDTATAGRVLYRGEDLTQADDRRLTEYRRFHVGFIFQFYNLIPSLTARENVAIVTEIARDPMEPEA